jgi:hypothetical protein
VAGFTCIIRSESHKLRHVGVNGDNENILPYPANGQVMQSDFEEVGDSAMIGVSEHVLL